MTSIATIAFLTLLSTQTARVEKVDLEALRAAIVPTSVEAWQTIPWRIDLLAARDEARREKKPLFLWTMNGHPLGCT
jgi:hypothetical protein